MEVLLDVQHLRCLLDRNTPLLHDVSFNMREGDTLILQGKSGCGKSTLLKCIAHLNAYEGEVLFRGKTAKELGIPNYRTHVLYVPQRPALLPGSPLEFLTQLSSFSTHKAHERHRIEFHNGRSLAERAMEIAAEWDVAEETWDRPWATLSGGEAQRISLATAIGLDCATILLLDEPTSALDTETSLRVEKRLRNMLSASDSCTKAHIWITHSPEQGQRVGTRFIEISDGSCREVLVSEDVV